jgi:transcriptional regulator EpsA
MKTGVNIPDLNDVAVLSQDDQERLLRTIEYALPVRKRSQLFVWAQGHLQSVIAHDLLLCVCADHVENTYTLFNISAMPLSKTQLSEMGNPAAGLAPCAIDAWGRLGEEPLMIHADMRNNVEYERLRGFLSRYKLTNLVVHGARSVDGSQGTYFIFAQIPHAFGARHAYLLHLVLPHLRMAFERMLATEHQNRGKETVARTTKKLLTGREVNILQWVQEGKSNRDIGAILQISPLTVKNHVRSILKKLNSQNRAQAVSRALALQILK